MFVFKLLSIVTATAVMMPAALAQQAGRPAPSDPATATPPARYESAFGGYVPHREPEVASWRNINDEAARIGGHVGILRQSGMPGGKPASPSPVGPAMPGHATGR